jgi:tetratricopeptide (TPR) repeat protein
MYEDPSPANLQAAEQFSQKAIELSPSLAEAHTSRGIALSLSKDYAGAEECFEKAIALDPRLFEAYYHYARMSFAAGNLQKAAGLFRDANRVRPEDYQSLLLAAQCFEKTGFAARAQEVREDGVAIVEEHLKLNPGDTRALYMGANGQAALGNSMAAIQWLQRALFLEPDDPMLLYNAGCVYALMGMEEEALASLDRAVDAGLNQKDWFEHDPDLNGLRSTDRFQEILRKIDELTHSGKKGK